ncbi:MAG: ABC transporter ATP-binding protein [Dermatophilaceae bacterium]
MAAEAPAGHSDPVEPAAVEWAVRTQGLTKRFGSQVAVDAVDLAVPRGAVYGFLGPNGSGKTTTIRMLLGLIRPTGGSARLLGYAVPGQATTVLHRVGSLVEGPAFHPYLSGRRNLVRLDVADVRADPRTRRTRISDALDRVGLLAAADKRYRAYSLGMRQRLALAAALLQPRDLLVLDEPTNGLDPQGTREVRTLVHSLAGDGTTVLVSSHLLSEVEQMCSHVGVLREGRLVAQGSVADIAASGRSQVLLRTGHPEQAVAVLAALGITGLTRDGEVVRGIPSQATSEELVAALVGAGVGVREFRVASARLEDWFVSLTGEGFDVSR